MTIARATVELLTIPALSADGALPDGRATAPAQVEWRAQMGAVARRGSADCSRA